MFNFYITFYELLLLIVFLISVCLLYKLLLFYDTSVLRNIGVAFMIK